MNNKQLIIKTANEINESGVDFNCLLALKKEIKIHSVYNKKQCHICNKSIYYYEESHIIYKHGIYINSICIECHNNKLVKTYEDNDSINCNCYICLCNTNKVKICSLQTNAINNTRTNKNILICENCITTCHCGNEVLKIYNEKCYMCNLNTCITCNSRLTTDIDKCNSCSFCDNCIQEYCTFGKIRICNNCKNSPNINYFEIVPEDIIFMIVNYLNVMEAINFLLTIKRCNVYIFKNLISLSKIGCWRCKTLTYENYKCFGCIKELCVNCVTKCSLCDTKIEKPRKWSLFLDNRDSYSDNWTSCYCTYYYLEYARNRPVNDNQYGWKFECQKCHEFVCHNCAVSYNDDGYDSIFCKNCK